MGASWAPKSVPGAILEVTWVPNSTPRPSKIEAKMVQSGIEMESLIPNLFLGAALPERVADCFCKLLAARSGQPTTPTPIKIMVSATA